MRQRPHHVVNALAYQNDSLSLPHRLAEFFRSAAAKLRPQNILEILFAEQVQAVAADAAQERVQQTRGKLAPAGVGEGSQQRHRRHARAARPALGKTLRVPGEIADRPKCAQLEQAPFDAPEYELTRVRGKLTPRRIGWLRHSKNRLVTNEREIRSLATHRYWKRRSFDLDRPLVVLGIVTSTGTGVRFFRKWKR